MQAYVLQHHISPTNSELRNVWWWLIFPFFCIKMAISDNDSMIQCSNNCIALEIMKLSPNALNLGDMMMKKVHLCTFIQLHPLRSNKTCEHQGLEQKINKKILASRLIRNWGKLFMVWFHHHNSCNMSSELCMIHIMAKSNILYMCVHKHEFTQYIAYRVYTWYTYM